MAGAVRFELTTNGLTVRCATAAPRPNNKEDLGESYIVVPGTLSRRRIWPFVCNLLNFRVWLKISLRISLK